MMYQLIIKTRIETSMKPEEILKALRPVEAIVDKGFHFDELELKVVSR